MSTPAQPSFSELARAVGGRYDPTTPRGQELLKQDILREAQRAEAQRAARSAVEERKALQRIQAASNPVQEVAPGVRALVKDGQVLGYSAPRQPGQKAVFNDLPYGATSLDQVREIARSVPAGWRTASDEALAMDGQASPFQQGFLSALAKAKSKAAGGAGAGASEADAPAFDAGPFGANLLPPTSQAPAPKDAVDFSTAQVPLTRALEALRNRFASAATASPQLKEKMAKTAELYKQLKAVQDSLRTGTTSVQTFDGPMALPVTQTRPISPQGRTELQARADALIQQIREANAATSGPGVSPDALKEYEAIRRTMELMGLSIAPRVEYPYVDILNMALYDLSPEQRQQVEAFLMQPPPAQFASASLPQGGATPNIPPETLLKAQMGLLGSQGRVIQQMAFQNERRQLEARAADVARQIQSVNPLDPERDVKISRLASAYPEEFASSVVQQSLGLNEAQRRQALGAEQEMQRQMEEQMKRQQEAQAASLYAGLQGASPEQIETFIQQNPEVAFRNRSVIDPALERQAVARTELDYLPAYKSAELQGQTPAKIRAEATKFTNSLPKPLRTLAQPDREEAVRLAQELKAARAAEATAQEGTEPNPDAPLPSDAIATRLTGLLGVEELDNGTVEALTESRAKVLGASDYLPPSARARLYEKLPK